MQLPRPGFELGATSPFPMTLTITPRTSEYQCYIPFKHTRVYNRGEREGNREKQRDDDDITITQQTPPHSYFHSPNHIFIYCIATYLV